MGFWYLDDGHIGLKSRAQETTEIYITVENMEKTGSLLQMAERSTKPEHDDQDEWHGSKMRLQAIPHHSVLRLARPHRPRQESPPNLVTLRFQDLEQKQRAPKTDETANLLHCANRIAPQGKQPLACVQRDETSFWVGEISENGWSKEVRVGSDRWGQLDCESSQREEAS